MRNTSCMINSKYPIGEALTYLQAQADTLSMLIGDEHEDRWKNVQHQANKMIEYASQTHLLLTIDISACYRYAEYLVGVWWVDDDGEVRTKQLVRGLSGLEMR